MNKYLLLCFPQPKIPEQSMSFYIIIAMLLLVPSILGKLL